MTKWGKCIGGPCDGEDIGYRQDKFYVIDTETIQEGYYQYDDGRWIWHEEHAG